MQSRVVLFIELVAYEKLTRELLSIRLVDPLGERIRYPRKVGSPEVEAFSIPSGHGNQSAQVTGVGQRPNEVMQNAFAHLSSTSYWYLDR